MIGLWIVLGVLVLLGLGYVSSYNRFVRQRNLVRESWRQIDVELTRRHRRKGRRSKRRGAAGEEEAAADWFHR